MKVFRSAILAVFLITLVSCQHLTHEVVSQDCTVAAAPAGFTRIYIGVPARGGQQSGTTAKDPLDGTTAEKFDTILRTIAKGQHPTWGAQANIAPEKLIACIASGTFQTNGQYDWNLSSGTHTQGSTLGFTVEKNWKIHGRGVDQTRLQLASYAPRQFVDLNGAPIHGGENTVVGTHSPDSSGIEISDLTIDANHDHMTSPGSVPLNLEGVVLRSNEGGHWIHNVNVIGGSGDVGFSNVKFETFAVQIWGNGQPLDPQQNTGSIVENVTVSKPGIAVVAGSPAGGAMDGIVINNAVAEVRNNVVDGYPVAYGGWAMGPVWFHDNIARNVQYGFNADSFDNTGVILQSNKFIHPSSYGIVFGGGDGTRTYTNWSVLNNTITLNTAGATGVVIRGQVRNATFIENTIATDVSSPRNMTAIWSFPLSSSMVNSGNSFQSNHIDKALVINTAQDPNFNTNCRYLNRDLQGKARADFPDNSSSRCR